MSSSDNKQEELKQLSEKYLFEELLKLIRVSSGLSITFCYLVLLLTSMAYLHLFYSEFDISIVKYVSLEDMLATPIKNPDILITYVAVILVLILADVGTRFRARKKLEYGDAPMPKMTRLISALLWAPINPKTNLRFTIATVFICIFTYIVVFADFEANAVKFGDGTQVSIVLNDQNKAIHTSLLGTSVNYVFTYDHKAKEATVFYVEAIKSIKSFTPVPEVINIYGNKKSELSENEPEND